jgi:hypothetical protein
MVQREHEGLDSFSIVKKTSRFRIRPNQPPNRAKLKHDAVKWKPGFPLKRMPSGPAPGAAQTRRFVRFDIAAGKRMGEKKPAFFG